MACEPVLHFGRFEIRPAERMLCIDGENAVLGARAFDLLLVLAERRGQLVAKQELLDSVWPGRVVEEHNIATQIGTLRKLLGPGVIATVAGRGYRFVATPAAPQPAPGPARHPLPEPRTRFIGRAAALADLARLLPRSRLTTLTGIGGSGKTRLALEFARQQRGAFARGVCFVDLAPLQSSQRVAPACAAALGLPDEHRPGLLDRIAAFLAAGPTLLVLDNCEQVREGAAALAETLLARPGAGRIVATSREPLGVAGEQLYPVRALSLPATSAWVEGQDADSVRLFADRAGLVVPGFTIDAGNAVAVAQICRRLDGIPLAIELAAARAALLPVAEIAARLGQSLRLVCSVPIAEARQRTLAATIQWSVDQLEPQAQHLLQTLAVFAGGWTLQAATAVAGCADDYETLALLTALHRQSLIVADASDSPRYRMLETVRQGALEWLRQSGRAETAQARHAEHFIVFAESVAPRLRGREQPQAMARLRREQENLVAALAWCTADSSPADAQWGLRLIGATARYWLFNEVALGWRFAEAALQKAGEPTDTRARFETLLALGQFNVHAGTAEAVLTWGREALALAQRQRDDESLMRALGTLASACSLNGDDEAALLHNREALALAEDCGNLAFVAMINNNIAEIERSLGHWRSAEQGYQRSLALLRAEGDPLSMLIVLHNLVRLMAAAGRHDAARAHAAEAEHLLRPLDEAVLKFELLKVCAGLASECGEHALAARWWAAGSTRFADAGYRDPRVDEQQSASQLAASRAALPAAAWAQAESAGRALTIDDAMLELRLWLAMPPAHEPSASA